MKNQIYQIVSVVAVIACFVPLLIVLLKKLKHVKPFLLFALYWTLGGLVNLIDFVHFSKKSVEVITVMYNALDMPLVLSIMYFTTSSPAIKKFTKVAIPVFTAFELVNLVLRGINYDALKYTLAIGLVIVLTVIVWEVILYLQKIQHTGLEKGLLFIYAALLFQYGTYIVIYIFDYYLEEASTTMDNFMVYYISSLIALAIAICGFLTRGVNKQPRFF